MKTIAVKCPNCGADLSLEEGRTNYFCQYCGAPIHLDDESTKIRITQHYVDEAEVRRVELEKQKYEDIRKNEIDLKQKKEEWNQMLKYYLVALAGSFFLVFIFGSGPGFLSTLVTGLCSVILLFGGVGLFILRPKSGEKTTRDARTVHVRIVNGRYSTKSKYATLFICFMFGIFGGHYFYVGRTGKGILYLFTFGLCGLGWLYDMVAIMTNRFTDKYGRVVY